MRIIASGFALLLLAAPAHAQNSQDPRWNRWLGCWELVLESSREGAPSPTTGAAREPRLSPRDAARPRVCVQPILTSCWISVSVRPTPSLTCERAVRRIAGRQPAARMRRTDVLPIPSRRAISEWLTRSALSRRMSSAFSEAVCGRP